MMISMAILSMAMLVIAGLQSASGHGIKDLYNKTRSRAARMKGLDQIRYTLVNAKIGTCVTSNASPLGGFYTIQYTDPTLGGKTSQFSFNATAHTLSYDADIAAAPAATVVVAGPIDISFTVLGVGSLIQLRVRDAASIDFGQTDTQDGITTVYLRNS